MGWFANHVPRVDLVVSWHAHQTFPRWSISCLNRHQAPLVTPGAFGNGWIEVHWSLEFKQKCWCIAQSHYQYMEVPQEIAPN